MTNKRARIGIQGAPSASVQLGSQDPRIRRASQVALAERTRLGDGLEVDERQRLRVAAAESPGSLSTGADLATAVAYIQDLVAQLRAAGLMKED